MQRVSFLLCISVHLYLTLSAFVEYPRNEIGLMSVYQEYISVKKFTDWDFLKVDVNQDPSEKLAYENFENYVLSYYRQSPLECLSLWAKNKDYRLFGSYFIAAIYRLFKYGKIAIVPEISLAFNTWTTQAIIKLTLDK